MYYMHHIELTNSKNGNVCLHFFCMQFMQFGKDFEAIQKYIEQRHKKRGDPGGQVKNKDQVI